MSDIISKWSRNEFVLFGCRFPLKQELNGRRYIKQKIDESSVEILNGWVETKNVLWFNDFDENASSKFHLLNLRASVGFWFWFKTDKAD